MCHVTRVELPCIIHVCVRARTVRIKSSNVNPEVQPLELLERETRVQRNWARPDILVFDGRLLSVTSSREKFARILFLLLNWIFKRSDLILPRP